MTTSPPGAGGAAPPSDRQLIDALRAGDEAAFVVLVEEHHVALLRLAMIYVPSRAVAEDVVQETWLGVLQGIGRFEARSSLKTWIFRILTNRAKTRGAREGRSIPFSALRPDDAEAADPAVEPARFHAADQRWAGHWASAPHGWDAVPEERLLSRETRAQLEAAIAALPPSQRAVLVMRDVEGWPSDEVCNVLEISETNQRVLLHRARSKVRRALEQYLSGE